MSDNGQQITPELVRTVVEETCQLFKLTLSDTLADFGLRDFQLINIRMALSKRFSKDVVVRFSDTIFKLTDRLNGVEHNLKSV